MKKLGPILVALFLAAASTAWPQDDWKDTHRVHLRNGNFLDGQLSERSETAVVLKFTPTTTLKIKLADVVRIELITIRPLGEALKTIELSPSPAPSPGPGVPTARPDLPPPSDTTDPQVSAVGRKVHEILLKWESASPSAQEALLKDLAATGLDGANYLIGLMEKSAPEATAYCFQIMGRAAQWRIDGPLRDLLRSSRSDLKSGAILVLGIRQAKSAAPAIERALKDSDPSVRAVAANSLARIGSPGSLEALAAACLDTDRTVRVQAAQAARTIAYQSERNNELAMTLASKLSSGHPRTRVEALRLVGNLYRTAQGSFPKEEVRTAMLYNLAELDKQARLAAVGALDDARAREAVAQILDAFVKEMDPDVIEAMCGPLANLGDLHTPGLVDALIERIRHSSPQVISETLKALKKVTRQVSVPDTYEGWWEWNRNRR